MPSERLNALAEGLGVPVPGPASALEAAEPEHVTALRMNVRYFIQSSTDRYGHVVEDRDRVAAIEKDILASDQYALSFFEQPLEVEAVPAPQEGAPFAESLWLDRLVGHELAPLPQVSGDPGLLPDNEYRKLVAKDESRRAIEDEAPELWISRMRYFEDTFGFRYRVKYVDKAGREHHIRSFTPDASEVFRILTEVPKPDWKIDDLAVSCHCDGKGFYGTTRDPSNWKDKVYSEKIYALEADRLASKPPGEKSKPFESSLESRVDAFRDLYTANARILLLMCWSVRVHNVMLALVCGKDVHYFTQECWISPFKLDLKGWYWDVPTMRSGHAPSGKLPDPKDCVELAREFLRGGA